MALENEEQDVGQEQEQETPPSLRDTLESAIEQVETPPEEKGEKKADEAPPKDVKSQTEGAKQEEKQGLKRDAKGRILPKDEKPEGEQKEEQQQLPRSRAPSSWRPSLREKWTTLAPEVQQEVLKREREISNGFNEIADIKKFRDGFLQTINPYNHIFQAEGGQPIETIHNLLKTSAILYNGAPMQKAATVAQIIKSFGVDIQMLDSLLSGQAQGGQGQGSGQQAQSGPDISQLVQQAVQQALAPVLRGQQEQESQQEQQAAESIEAFANDPKNEFFDDVKEIMADLLEAAANRGQQMDLSTAYNRAILAHNDIADIVAERRIKEKTATGNQAAAAARRKAVSISGAPANSSASQGNPTNLRGAIENAIEQLGT